jgi:hypothetical protein
VRLAFAVTSTAAVTTLLALGAIGAMTASGAPVLGRATSPRSVAPPAAPAGPRTSTTTTTATTTTTTTTLLAIAAAPATTKVEFFEPYVAKRLDASVHVVGTESGSCFSGSLPVDDPHAWRCLSGDEILDPCFAPPSEVDPTTLACGSPWSGVELLRLDEPLPRQLADRGTAPSAGWLLQLANGARCQASEGAAGINDGVAIAYLCSGGSAAGALDWSEEPWSVRFLSASSRAPEDVAVTVAWGG